MRDRPTIVDDLVLPIAPRRSSVPPGLTLVHREVASARQTLLLGAGARFLHLDLVPGTASEFSKAWTPRIWALVRSDAPVVDHLVLFTRVPTPLPPSALFIGAVVTPGSRYEAPGSLLAFTIVGTVGADG